jgi:hypothetical protein
MTSAKPLLDLAELDQLLSMDFLQVPQGFEQQVLRRMTSESGRSEPLPLIDALVPLQISPTARLARRVVLACRWLALASGSALALAELIAFLFGFWTSSAAL